MPLKHDMKAERLDFIAGLLVFGPCCTVGAGPVPPTSKELWQLAFLNHHLPLATANHCRGAGTSPGDRTLGAYLAGCLSELADKGDNQVLGQCLDADNRSLLAL